MPAIAVTAYTGVDQRRRALDAGFQAHLSKPIAPSDLLAAVARFGAERRAVENGEA